MTTPIASMIRTEAMAQFITRTDSDPIAAKAYLPNRAIISLAELEEAVFAYLEDEYCRIHDC